MYNAYLHFKYPLLISLLAVPLLFFLPACTDPDKEIEEKFAEASALVDDGQAEEAIPALRELREEQPDRADIAERLAFAYSFAGRDRDAADTFSDAARLAEGRDDLLLFAGQAYAQAGDLEQAANHYRLFLVPNQENVSGWHAFARVEEERGRLDSATDAWRTAFRLRPEADTAARIGELYLERRNVPQAARWFNDSLEQGDEAEARAKAGLLQIHLDEENWSQAADLVEELDESYPDYLDEAGLSNVREELREWRAAQEEFERVIREREAEDHERREQDQRQAREQREMERLAREEEERRLREAEEALAREEERLAREEERLAREEAEAAARRAAPDPRRDQAERLAADARVAHSERRLDRAISLYWQALAHDDTTARTWHELSRALYNSGRHQEAESTALEAIRRAPDREDYYIHYLNVVSETQSVRRYLRELEQAQERFPRNISIVYELAETYARGDWSQEQAARYYRRFLRMSAADDPRRERAEAYVRQYGR